MFDRIMFRGMELLFLCYLGVSFLWRILFVFGRVLFGIFNRVVQEDIDDSIIKFVDELKSEGWLRLQMIELIFKMILIGWNVGMKLKS